MPEFGLVDDATAKHFRRSYWAAVSFIDHQVGAILQELGRLQLREDTVVAFIGDHGWQLGDLGEFGKKTNFERATRAPFIIQDPIMLHSGAVATKSLALVEFVDLMPTLIDLAMGIQIPTCPANSTEVALCTEGKSLKQIIRRVNRTKAKAPLRTAAFMQYAACMHDEGVWHDACADPQEPQIMGYAIRTRQWRYIEWVRFQKAPVPTPLWDELLGSELYDHTLADTVDNKAESINVVGEPNNTLIVQALSKQLHAGWRAAITTTHSLE